MKEPFHVMNRSIHWTTVIFICDNTQINPLEIKSTVKPKKLGEGKHCEFLTDQTVKNTVIQKCSHYDKKIA